MKTILFLAANPLNASSLQLDKELREVKEGLRRSNNNEFILQSGEAVRPRDMQRAMLEHEPTFVHFSGHGNSDGISLLNSKDESCLVTTKALAELFNLFSDKIVCVLLNSCHSESQAKAISKSIPYVVGMSASIGDKAAIDFATSFYDAIGAGKSIKFAYELGCNAINLDNNNASENSTPMLYTKDNLDITTNIDALFEYTTFKNKVSIIDKKISSVVNSTDNSHKELIEWILRTTESQGEKIANKVINKFRNTEIKTPTSEDDIEDYLFDISNFTKRICYSLAHDDRNVISTPRVSQNLKINTFDTKLYKEFFNELLNFASKNDFQKESLNKFSSCSDQLLKNIF